MGRAKRRRRGALENMTASVPPYTGEYAKQICNYIQSVFIQSCVLCRVFNREHEENCRVFTGADALPVNN